MENFFAVRLVFRLPASLSLALVALFAACPLHGQSVTYAGTSSSLNFGSVNVCPSGATAPAPCGSTATLTYSVAAGTTIGGVGIYTAGSANLDFQAEANDSSATLCSAKTYALATTCTVDVTFAPFAPGQRRGAVQIVDGGGNTLAMTYIYGAGVAPAIGFTPAPIVELGSGFNSPVGVAVDGAGDVFVADYFNNAVKEILAVDGSIPANPTIRTLASIPYPYGLAVDDVGNVYASDNVVNEIVAVNGSIPDNPTIRTLETGSFLGGVTVDGNGNVFVANFFNGVEEIPAVNGSIPDNPTINTVYSGFDFMPLGVAADASGDVFVAAQGSELPEILAVGGSVPADPTVINVANGFGGFQSVAVDGLGNAYVADYGFNKVWEVAAVDGSIPANPAVNVLVSGSVNQLGATIGYPQPTNVAADGIGDVFFTTGDEAQEGPYELQRSQPSSLSFYQNNPSGTGPSSPQSVQIQNIGNATLSLSGLSVSENFSLVSGPGAPPDCTATSSLSPGAECNLNISFTPGVGGPLTGAATVSDNTLNRQGATQTIQLSGIRGTPPPQVYLSTDSLGFNDILFTDYETTPLTITNTGGGTLTLSPSINGPSYTIASSTCGAGVAAGGSCVLQVKFAPIAIGPHHDILTLQTNASTNPTVTLRGLAIGVGSELESPLEFGTIAVGTTKVLLLTIIDLCEGHYADCATGLATIATSVNGPSYKVLTNAQNTCLAGIFPGQTCTLPIEFDPVSAGMHDDILTLTPSYGRTPSKVHIDGFAD